MVRKGQVKIVKRSFWVNLRPDETSMGSLKALEGTALFIVDNVYVNAYRSVITALTPVGQVVEFNLWDDMVDVLFERTA